MGKVVISMIAFVLCLSVQRAGAEVQQKQMGSGPQADNCVRYLKDVKGVSMPANLWTLEDKLKMKNENKPKKGRIAIIRTPGYNDEKGREIGHVALITKVDDDGKKQSITLEEANFPRPGYWKRKATARSIKAAEGELKIVGYFQP